MLFLLGKDESFFGTYIDIFILLSRLVSYAILYLYGIFKAEINCLSK